MRRAVVPFQITLGPRLGDGIYAVSASLRGEEINAKIELAPWLLDLADELLALGQPPTPIADPQEIGQALGRALFAAPLRDLLLRAARDASGSGERLQIRLQLAAYELAALPWEWLTLGQTNSWTPALREDYPLVRASRRKRPLPPAVISGPLRVLAVAARGEEGQLHALEAALGSELRAGRVALRLLEDATPAAMERALAGAPCHVLHLAAHVGLTHDERLEVALGPGLDAEELAELLEVAEDLRLVTIAGTHSSRREGSTARLAAGPGLLGSMLLDTARPATVAFGGPLTVELAAFFAASSYAELAQGAPADLAVTSGRQTLVRRSAGHMVPLPQLRLLPGAERLFELRAAPRPFSDTTGGRRPGPARHADEDEAPAANPRPAWLSDAWRSATILHPWSFAVLVVIGAALALLLLFGGRLFSESAGEPDVRAAEQTDEAIATAELPNAPRNPFAITATPELAAPPAITATPAPALEARTLPEPAGYVSVTAAEGETGAQIAERLGSDPQLVGGYNRIDPAAPLRAGRQLIVPLLNPPPSVETGEIAAGEIVARGNPAAARVALTFDIELDDVSLYGILEVLSSRGLKGTFFVTGRWVERYPDAARAIVNDGHEIANHSLTHPSFSAIGLDGATSEIRETERIVREVTGATTRPYFRFPYGDSTADTQAIVTAEGYMAYHWAVADDEISGWIAGLSPDPAAGNGGILLMHGRDSTVARLPEWLDQLQALGLQPTTLSEALR